MANKIKETATADVAVLDTSTDLLAELEEHEAEQAKAAAVPVADAVVLSHDTVLTTNTVYEDRTHNPEVEKVIEYETVDVDLGNGTIFTDVGEAKA